MLCIGWWVLLLLVAGGPRASAQVVDVLPPSGQWVTDEAGMLTAAQRSALSRTLQDYADSTSTQIIVVTLPSLQGNDPGLYATELGQQWGVGQEGRDNGAVVLVSRDDRQLFIATGFGLEGAIPDAVASRIIRNEITPAFRRGDYYSGLNRGVGAMMAAAAGEYTAERSSSGSSGSPLPSLAFMLFIFILIVRSATRGGSSGPGRRRRGRGGADMFILGSMMGSGTRRSSGGGFGGGGFGGGGFGGGGFSGGGGGFGGGGAGGGW